MSRVILSFGKVYLLALFLVLQGCSSLKESSYVPKSPEGMSEWRVEGKLELFADDEKSKSYFYYQQIDENYELGLLMDERVGDPQATIRGNVFEPGSESVDVTGGADAVAVAEHLRASISAGNLSYWLRGLPATESAEIYKDGNYQLDRIEEAGWDIRFRDYMSLQGNYRLPSDIKLEGDDKGLILKMVRGDTGYLAHPCEKGVSDEQVAATNDPARDSDVVAQLVPRDGSAPLPRWINEVDFCRQLAKIHNDKLPNPREGLYGPDSMMWKVTGLALPSGFGAGRALLLQVAHPWVTAGIDEHSVVRDDPLGRARRTFYHISNMVYGSTSQAMTSANQVRDIHEEIEGHVTEQAGAFDRGSEYRANEINAMIWVHATLWETSMHMYEEMIGTLSQEEKDQYYEETKLFAMLFGIPESALPKDWNEFMAYNEAMWDSPQLTVTNNALQLKKDLFDAKSIWMIFPLWGQEIITSAELPPRIRDQYNMKYGLWQKLNYGWMRAGAWTMAVLLPKSMERHAIYREAEARLEGKRLGGYNQWLIEAFFDKERIVN